MKALISILEPRETGYRVADVVADGDIFDVSSALFWVECSDQIVRDEYWYDPSDETIKAIPVPAPQPQVSAAVLMKEINDRINKLKLIGLNLSSNT